MNFASDNIAGASPQVLQAIVEANEGLQKSYGVDDYTLRAEKKLAEVFETDIAVFTVATGTAANSLALSAMVPPWGGVVTHPASHISTDECGAPEFFTSGAKLMPLQGVGAKPLAKDLAHFFATNSFRPVHQVQPMALSVSQATECGLVYKADEIAALAAEAKTHKLLVHMDGARFANALVSQNATPAALTWKAGVDVMSFGATKNGCLAGEAVIFFNKELAKNFEYRRKRSGQLLSKGRLFGAQLDAYLRDGHWLALASHANAMAKKLSDGLVSAGARLGWATDANQVFPILPKAMHERMTAAGAVYYPWPSDGMAEGTVIGPDEILVRMVVPFTTRPADVDMALAAANPH